MKKILWILGAVVTLIIVTMFMTPISRAKSINTKIHAQTSPTIPYRVQNQ